MKNKLLFLSLLVFSLLFVSIVERSFSEDETFSIVNIEKDSGGKKVEIYLNHEVHYFNLVSWPGSKGAKIVPNSFRFVWKFIQTPASFHQLDQSCMSFKSREFFVKFSEDHP